MLEMHLPPYQVSQVFDALPQSQSLNWGHAHIGIDFLHSRGFTGKGIRVAVIDTGVEDHEDLSNNLVFIKNVSGESWGTSAGHGTGVAGIIAAEDNERGIKGIAPGSHIYAIKAMREDGGGSYSSIIAGLRLAREKGCQIINLSLGGSVDSQELKTEIDICNREGALVVCAAGNSGGRKNSVMYPGRYTNTFCVGAINERGKTSAFSSRGWELNCCAPGERLLTTYVENTYSMVSGTSFAAPVVSGVLACLLEAGIMPTLDLIAKTSIDIEEEGLDIKSGYGVISPERLFNQARVTEGEPEYSELKESYYLLGKFLRDNGVIV